MKLTGLVLVLQFQLIDWSDATGKIAAKFLKYAIPEGKKLNGYCCDSTSWWGVGDCEAGDTCDPGFVVCLGNETESSDIEACEFGRKATGQLGENTNEILFKEKLGESHNPLVFDFEEWPGVVKLKILAIDTDEDDRYDIVDTFSYQYNQYDLVRELDTSPKTLKLSGSRSSLDIELKVFCDQNYYGRDCNTYCYPGDDDDGHFMCDPITGKRNCLTGWTGTECLTNIDDCVGHRCSYGASCKDAVNSYTCVCSVGRTGVLCEAEINECSSNPCQYGGTCHDARGFFYCDCPAGTSGDYCQIDNPECISDPCQNNATCIDHINAYECSCMSGFTGDHCETDIDECSLGMCVEADRCIDLLGDYQCVCRKGFTGKNCEYNIDDCTSSPCQHKGSCVDGIDSFLCVCKGGTTGEFCEVNYNECESIPCQNGGTCEDEINSYKCTCSAQYTGTFCETKTNLCDSLPCQNGGSCSEQGANITCKCNLGYEGDFCEEESNECDPNPCENGGTCLDNIGSFECVCPPMTSGFNCSEIIETTTLSTTPEPTTTELTTPELTTLVTTSADEEDTTDLLDGTEITSTTSETTTALATIVTSTDDSFNDTASATEVTTSAGTSEETSTINDTTMQDIMVMYTTEAQDNMTVLDATETSSTVQGPTTVDASNETSTISDATTQDTTVLDTTEAQDNLTVSDVTKSTADTSDLNETTVGTVDETTLSLATTFAENMTDATTEIMSSNTTSESDSTPVDFVTTDMGNVTTEGVSGITTADNVTISEATDSSGPDNVTVADITDSSADNATLGDMSTLSENTTTSQTTESIEQATATLVSGDMMQENTTISDRKETTDSTTLTFSVMLPFGNETIMEGSGEVSIEPGEFTATTGEADIETDAFGDDGISAASSTPLSVSPSDTSSTVQTEPDASGDGAELDPGDTDLSNSTSPSQEPPEMSTVSDVGYGTIEEEQIVTVYPRTVGVELGSGELLEGSGDNITETSTMLISKVFLTTVAEMDNQTFEILNVTAAKLATSTTTSDLQGENATIPDSNITSTDSMDTTYVVTDSPGTVRMVDNATDISNITSDVASNTTVYTTETIKPDRLTLPTFVTTDAEGEGSGDNITETSTMLISKVVLTTVAEVDNQTFEILNVTAAKLATSTTTSDLQGENATIPDSNITSTDSMDTTYVVTDSPGTVRMVDNATDISNITSDVASNTTVYTTETIKPERLTLPTFVTTDAEDENITTTVDSFVRPSTMIKDIFVDNIEVVVMVPEPAGTTLPLLTFPDRARPTTDDVFTDDTIYSLWTTVSTTLTNLFSTAAPKTTTDQYAGPPPPEKDQTTTASYLIHTQTPKVTTPLPKEDQKLVTIKRGDQQPEEDVTTSRTSLVFVQTTGQWYTLSSKRTRPVVDETTPKPPPIKTLPPVTKGVTLPNGDQKKSEKNRTVTVPTLNLPTIRMKVYHTVKKAYNVGKKIADQAYKKAKGLLMRTLRRLSDLWKVCVKGAFKVIYSPYYYGKNFYTATINKGSRVISNAYKYTKSRLRKYYGNARRLMSSYYTYLRDYYRKRYNYYYQQYYNYYRNLKNNWWNYFG